MKNFLSAIKLTSSFVAWLNILVDWCLWQFHTILSINHFTTLNLYTWNWGMIGTGRAHVHTVVSIAQAQCMDGPTVPAVQAFASLGGGGLHPSNEERDLHRWLKNLYQIDMEVYTVRMNLQVWGKICFRSMCKHQCYISEFHILQDFPEFPWGIQLSPTDRNDNSSSTPTRTYRCCGQSRLTSGGVKNIFLFAHVNPEVDACCYPNESKTSSNESYVSVFKICPILGYLLQGGFLTHYPFGTDTFSLCQFALSMLGNRSSESVGEFWDHCLGLREWQKHPAFVDPTVDRKCSLLSFVGKTFCESNLAGKCKSHVHIKSLVSRCHPDIFPHGWGWVLPRLWVQLLEPL